MMNDPQSPYTTGQWQAIDALGRAVDSQLQRWDVRLMMGGEPTFVSATDFQSAQWRVEALGKEKRAIAGRLFDLLAREFAAAGSLLHQGVGKLYPGEAFPRWSLGCYWRQDGAPLWRDRALLVGNGGDGGCTIAQAKSFIEELARQLHLDGRRILPAWEAGGDEVVGYALPLLLVARGGELGWSSCPWTLASDRLNLLPGKAALGLRLPIGELPEVEPLERESLGLAADADIELPLDRVGRQKSFESPPNSIRVALCLEVRGGALHVFLPPFASALSFLHLVRGIEGAAAALQQPVVLEGYTPPPNQGISGFQIAPDPGVIEVNVHPAATWDELVQINCRLYAAARQCGLGMEKYALDGWRLSTGGGAHITLGGKCTADSPLLRRPDLLRSLLTYWQHHPSLSYLFAGLFVGPTSQSPRPDETRCGNLPELELALQALEPGVEMPPAALDQLLGHLLTDVAGNTHRAAFCIDKLFPVNNLSQQLGLLELRAFTMPPHEQMRMVQLLLVRAIVCRCWQQPYTCPLVRWGTALHDRFFLPYYLAEDLQQVLEDLKSFGFSFHREWFEPFFAFRFPICGRVLLDAGGGATLELELRHAMELWPVVGEQMAGGGAARLVDNSLERIQVGLGVIAGNSRLEGLPHRYQILCNGRAVPLRAAGEPDNYVGGVRFRARQIVPVPHALFQPHTPLTFEVVDGANGRSLGGCRYYAESPDGKSYDTYPSTAAEAAARMARRFVPLPPTAGKLNCPPPTLAPESPITLDLRWGCCYSREGETDFSQQAKIDSGDCPPKG